MVDSTVVLNGQTLGYTLYCIVIILLIGWFEWRLTRPGKARGIKPAVFYVFVALLAAVGFSLHLITIWAAGFLAFFFNIVISVGLNGVLGIFRKSELNKNKLV